MPTHFKELRVWQNAHTLALLVYKTTKSFPVEERIGLTSQIRRAVISISSNIAEGSGRYTDKDKLHFLAIARGSLFEVRSQIALAEGLKYVSKENFDILDNKCEELLKQLNAFIGALRSH